MTAMAAITRDYGDETIALSCVHVGHNRSIARGQHNRADVGACAKIDGSGGQNPGPHLFVRETVGTNDVRTGELPVQTLNLHERGVLQVDDRHVGPMARYRAPQLIQIPGHVNHAKVVQKGLGERFGIPNAALVDYDT
jgi:hypothetical protein